MKITRDKLPEHPVSALANMADWGWIPTPVYVGQPLTPDGLEYALVAEIQGYGHRVATGDTKADAKRKAAEALLRHVLSMMCPHPEKMRYATEDVAYGTVERHQNIGITGIRHAYECRCGWWHLSSQTGNVRRRP
jgi:hypothetical protein